jgi:hypothetical protein
MNSLKIFTAIGNQQITKLEGDVNDWLKTLAADIEVKLTDVALDRVSNNQTGGEDRRLMLMVWTGQR